VGDPENAGTFSDSMSYLFYVNSYYALRPLLIQDYEE